MEEGLVIVVVPGSRLRVEGDLGPGY